MSGYRANTTNVSRIHIRGIDTDITTQHHLQQIFSQYGQIRNILYNGTRPYANVSYTTPQAAELAVNEFKTNVYKWYVCYAKEKTDKPSNPTHQAADRRRENGGGNNNPNEIRSPSASSLTRNSDTMDYSDDLLTFNEDDYVDVHGRSLTVLTSPEGQMFVPLNEIRQTGFAIFRKDNYESLLISNSQIQKEFVMHLLAEGRSFLLRNQVRALDENKITEAIAKAQDILLHNNGSRENGFVRDVQDGGNRADARVSRGQFRDPPESNSTPIPRSRENFGRDGGGGGGGGNFSRDRDHRDGNSVRDDRRSYDNRNSRQFNSSRSDFGNKNRVIENKGENGLSITARVKPPGSGDNTAPALRKPHQSIQAHDEEVRNEVVAKPVPEKPSTAPKGQPTVAAAAAVNPDQSVHLSTGYSSLKPEFQEAVVAFVESSNVCWVCVNQEDVATILLDAADSGPSARKADPVVGQVYLAVYTDNWYRAVVLQLSPLKVLFIDFGNVEEADEVRVVPAELSSFPAQAIKVEIEDVCGKELVEDMPLTLKPVKKLGENYYLVVLKDAANRSFNDSTSTSAIAGTSTSAPKVEPPTEKSKAADPVPKSASCYGKPEPMEMLGNGDMVMILEEKDGKLYVVTRNCYKKAREIAEKLMNFQGERIPSPSKNQLVIVRLSSEYRRAVVTNISGSSVEVEYVDHPGGGTVDRSDVRNVDTYLGFQPATVLVTPRLRLDGPLTVDSRRRLQNFIDTKQKFTLKITGEKFDLEYDNLSLTEEINRINGPPPNNPATSGNGAGRGSNKMTLHDITFQEVQNGVGDYMVASLRSSTDFTLFAMNEEVMQWLEAITTPDVPNAPYAPEIDEVCLGLYDGGWYRCAVLEQKKGDSFDVFFLDYGNTELLTSDNLRKLPDNLRNIPIFGLTCAMKGVPAENGKIDAELANLMPAGTELEVNLLKTDEGTYTVEIDSITSELKKLGLL